MKLLKLISPLLLTILPGCASLGDRPDPATLNELAPTGKLRFGLVFAPEQSVFFVVKGADGTPRGVSVDLANELAQHAGVPVEFVLAPNSGIVTDAVASGSIDAAFMPVDDERRKLLGIGPIYLFDENTYLVRAGSDIKSIAEVDRPGVRVIGIAGTTTIRSAGRTLKNAKISPAASVEAALEMLRSGQADAFALTHQTLPALAVRVPGSRILEGAFQRINIAVVLPKDRPNALAYVTGWMEGAKASGAVRRALDKAGFKDIPVAPPTTAP